MLEIRDLNVSRAEIKVLNSVSLVVDAREIVALLGANGAGKTTLVEAICGVLQPSAGSISLLGAPIHGLAPHRIAALGLSSVPEGRRLFPEMTVLENLQMGAYGARARSALAQSLEYVYSVFPALREKKDALSSSLSGGQQQMLAIGRALMSRPTLVVIDELSLGLSPKLTVDILSALTRLRDEGMTILLVEQNASLALRHADRAYVLETGRIALEGKSAQLLANDHVRRAYLGL